MPPMSNRDASAAGSLLQAAIPTAEGLLEIRARKGQLGWSVTARCARWTGTGIGLTLRAAADAALSGYAAGVALDGLGGG